MVKSVVLAREQTEIAQRVIFVVEMRLYMNDRYHVRNINTRAFCLNKIFIGAKAIASETHTKKKTNRKRRNDMKAKKKNRTHTNENIKNNDFIIEFVFCCTSINRQC